MIGQRRWFSLFALVSCLFACLTPCFGRVGARADQSNQSAEAVKAESDLQSNAITRVEPVYPPLAKAARVTGTVIVEVVVDEAGNVESAQAIAGHPLLRDAAVAAAKGWKWAPAKKDGAAIKVKGTLTFNFTGDSQEPRFKQEIDDAKQAVQKDPSSAEAQYRLGLTYSMARSFDEAIAAFKEAIRLKPDYKEALVALGDAYKNVDRDEEAIQTYRQGLMIAPNDRILLLRLSMLFEAKHRWTEAIDAQRQIVQLDPKNADTNLRLGWYYFQAYQFNQAIAYYNQALSLRPDFALAYHNLGAAYNRLGRHEDAIAAYKKALEIKPVYYQSDKVYVAMVDSYIFLGRYDDAEEAAHKGIEAYPDYEPLYMTLANVYYREERWREAIDTYKTAIQKNPNDPYPVAGIGFVDRLQGRLIDAEKMLRQAIQMNSRVSVFYIELARVLHTEHKFDEEESELRQAEKNSPNDFNVHMALGFFLANAKKLDPAISEFRQAVSLNPRNEVALNDLGYYMAEKGENLPEALKYIQQAVAARPEFPNYLDSLGWVYFKMGKLDLAEENMLKAIRTGGKDPTIQEHLGDVYDREGKKAEALDQWKKALAFATDADQSTRLKAKIDGTTTDKAPDKKN